MKKLYTLLSLTVLAFSANAATNWPVVVGMNCSFSAANTYCPTATSCTVGDTVTFVLGAGVHTATSTSVPSGAAPINSGTMSSPGAMYTYVVTKAGTYNFQCTIHGSSMSGTINAVASNVTEASVDLATIAFPNPFRNSITFKYNSITSIDIMNVVGEKVKHIELSPVETQTVVEFEGIPAGVYFYRTYNKEGVIVETKKIVKSK
jgi:plastocyanin